MKSFELIIYPTEQCNFRCSYCYEDFEIGRMKPEVIENIKKLIDNRLETVDFLYLNWFGGEPLIAQDIVFDIATYAYEQARLKNKILKGGFTSNAYHLTVDLAQRLYELNQSSYQISLDGYDEQHDKTRKLASGKGTFKKIWGNLLALKESEIPFNILLRLHITKENFESVKMLAKEIKNHFLIDPRFSIFIKAVGDWGGDNKIKDQLFIYKDSEEKIKEIKAILFENEENNIKAKQNTSSQTEICYAAKPNSLAIRATGMIQKCTVMLKDERNNVGEFDKNGNIILDKDLMKIWMRGLYTNDEKSLNCPANKLPKIEKNNIELINIA